MNIQQAYNSWASQYDTNRNKTRDLEGQSLRETLNAFQFESCLEIGCGTGKNTVWLAEKVKHLTAVDFSGEMLNRARKKSPHQMWSFIRQTLPSRGRSELKVMIWLRSV